MAACKPNPSPFARGISIQEDVGQRGGGDGLDVMGRDGEGVLEEQAIAERMPHRAEGHGGREKTRGHHGELDRRLAPAAARDPYRLLMPSEMAVHNC